MPEKENPLSDQSEKRPIATELAGITIESSSSVPASAKNEKESVPAPLTQSQFSLETKFPFLSFIHEYVWTNIQFAEQKAAFVFAADTAFLGYLVTTMPSYFMGLHRFQQVLILTALIFLLMSLASVLSVIAPRLRGYGRGLIYFGAISTRADAAEYISDILRANQSESDSAIAHHIYELARICNRKQSGVRWGIWLGIIGFVAGLLWLIVLRLTASPPPNAALIF